MNIKLLISFIVQMKNLQALIRFEIVQTLTVNVFLDITYIYKCIGSIFPMEPEIVPEHSGQFQY